MHSIMQQVDSTQKQYDPVIIRFCKFQNYEWDKIKGFSPHLELVSSFIEWPEGNHENDTRYSRGR
jgi:hypothetical protein